MFLTMTAVLALNGATLVEAAVMDAAAADERVSAGATREVSETPTGLAAPLKDKKTITFDAGDSGASNDPSAKDDRLPGIVEPPAQGADEAGPKKNPETSPEMVSGADADSNVEITVDGLILDASSDDEIVSETFPGLSERSEPAPLNEPEESAPNRQAAPVFESETDDAVVEKIIDHLQVLNTLKADFRQAAPSGAITQGKFWLRRPRQLRMQYGTATDANDDAPLLIVASQGFVYVRDNALETTDSYPVNQTPLRFLLSKKVSLEELEVISVYRGEDSVSVTFADPEGDAEGDLTAVFDAPELALKQWIVRDPQQGLTVVTLSNREPGAKLANRLFRTPEAGGQFINN
ncbi:MAG: outer-membrane lipoprotein carrier protein LolA [Pseudomonadota bacterium]